MPPWLPHCAETLGFLKHVEIGIGLGFTIVLIEIGEPFGNGSTEWVSPKWDDVKQNPSNNQPKSQSQTVKRYIYSINYNKTRNSKPTKSRKITRKSQKIVRFLVPGIKAPRSAVNSAKLGRHWTLLAMAPRAWPQLIFLDQRLIVVSWDFTVKKCDFHGILLWNIVVEWDFTMKNGDFMWFHQILPPTMVV